MDCFGFSILDRETMRKIIFVVNSVHFLLSHRIDICIEAIRSGYEVHVAAPFKLEGINQLRGLGIIFHEVNFSRKGKNIISEMLVVISLYQLFKTIKPDLVHLITIKPYLYGGIASRLSNVPSVVSAVSSSQFLIIIMITLIFRFPYL